MSTVLQLLGLGTITAGVMLMSIPIGFIVGGIALTLIGYALGQQK